MESVAHFVEWLKWKAWKTSTELQFPSPGTEGRKQSATPRVFGFAFSVCQHYNFRILSSPPGSPSRPTQRWPIAVVRRARSPWNHKVRAFGHTRWSIWIKLNPPPFQHCHLLFFFFLKFPQERKDQPHWRARGPGKGQQPQPSFPWSTGNARTGRALGEAWNQKASVFFSDNSGPTYLPLVSVAAQQVSAWSPNRWRQGQRRAANPTEWLPLSGQELSRKSFQALTTAESCAFNQPPSQSIKRPSMKATLAILSPTNEQELYSFPPPLQPSQTTSGAFMILNPSSQVCVALT